MTGSDLKVLAAQVREARAVLLDWDGCLVQSGALMPGAARFLALVGERAFVLSNNSTDLAGSFSRFLLRRGIAHPPERILLAGEQALELAAGRWAGQSIHLVADPAMKACARSLGLVVDREGKDSQVVLLMRDTRFTYSKLTRAVAALRRGAKLVVANIDQTHPADRNQVKPETGALLAAIEACLDISTVEVEVIGKPEPLLFQTALARAGIKPSEAVMIGDNPKTDVAGAERLGVPAIGLSPAEGVTLASLVDAMEGWRPERHLRVVSTG